MNRLKAIVSGLSNPQKRMLLDLLGMHPVGGIRVEGGAMYIDNLIYLGLVHEVRGNTTNLQVYKLTLGGHEVAKKLKGSE
jgi:hypothetical protein